MEYMIFDSSANLIESFDDLTEARAALAAIADAEPESADEYALVEFGDNGRAVGAATSAAELTAA